MTSVSIDAAGGTCGNLLRPCMAGPPPRRRLGRHARHSRRRLVALAGLKLKSDKRPCILHIQYPPEFSDRAQPISLEWVECVSCPENSTQAGATHLHNGGKNFREENCSFAAACNVSRSRRCIRTGGSLCSRGAPRAHRRGPRASVASRLGLGRWISPLERSPLRLGPRLLGSSAASRRCLGCASLGTARRRLVPRRRPLAVKSNGVSGAGSVSGDKPRVPH